MRNGAGRLIVALALSAMVDSRARAQNCDPATAWTQTLSSTYGTAAALWTASDRGLRFGIYLPADTKIFVAKGSNLIALWDETANGHARGAVAWTLAFSSTIETAPVVFPRSADSRPTLLVGVAGLVYVINPESGAALRIETTIDTRRSATQYPDDKVGYVPAVVLGAPEYQAGVAVDTILVSTRRTGLYSNVTNAVIAYTLSGTELWRTPLTASLDGGVGCSLDYSSKMAYCGFTQSQTSQNTLIKVRYSDGVYQWGTNVGALPSPPVLRGSHLFTVSTIGTVTVVDPTLSPSVENTPTPNFVVASLSTANSATVGRPFYVESRSPGSFQFATMFVDSAGYLNAISFNPTSPDGARLDMLFPRMRGPGGLWVFDVPTLDIDVGRMYVPLANGNVERAEIVSGGFGYGTFAAAGGTSALTPGFAARTGVADTLTLVYENTSRATVISRRCTWGFDGNPTTRVGGRSAGITDDIGADRADTLASPPSGESETGAGAEPAACPCGPPPDPCQVPSCTEGSCVFFPAPDDSPCDASCGGAGNCQGGRCIASSGTGACACNQIGGPGCPPNQACCGTGCVDLKNDVSNCGGCSHACMPTWKCVDGACKQPVCTATVAPSKLNTLNLKGTDITVRGLFLLPMSTGECMLGVSTKSGSQSRVDFYVPDAVGGSNPWLNERGGHLAATRISPGSEPYPGWFEVVEEIVGRDSWQLIINYLDGGLINRTGYWDYLTETSGTAWGTGSQVWGNADTWSNLYSPTVVGTRLLTGSGPITYFQGSRNERRLNDNQFLTYSLEGNFLFSGAFYGVRNYLWQQTTLNSPPTFVSASSREFTSLLTMWMPELAFVEVPLPSNQLRRQMYWMAPRDISPQYDKLLGYRACTTSIGPDYPSACAGATGTSPIDVSGLGFTGNDNVDKMELGSPQCNAAGDCYFDALIVRPGPIYERTMFVIRGLDGKGMPVADYQRDHGIYYGTSGYYEKFTVWGDDFYGLSGNSWLYHFKVPR